MEILTEKIVEQDETIPELPHKDLVSSYIYPAYIHTIFTQLEVIYVFADSSLVP